MRWGILGPGRISRQFLAGLQKTGDQTAVAVGSRDQGRADAAAVEYGVAAAYGSYDAVLADPDVEAVYIGLPNAAHAEWTAAAVRAGKHVLCEKPMGITAEQARAMFALATEHGVRLVEAFMYRFHPRTRRLVELVAGGAIGELRAIHASLGFSCDPADERLTDGVGGGALRDVGCYPVSIAGLLAAAPVVGVNALARWAPSGADTLLTGTIEYANGVHAQISGSLDTGHHQDVHVIGSTGDLLVPEPFIQPSGEPARLLLRRRGTDGPTEHLTFGVLDQYAAEATGFARLVAGGAEDPMPAAHTVANAVTIDALLSSARSAGARVTIGA